LEAAHLERARSRCRELEGRVSFKQGDALSLPFGPGEFDLVVSRHLLQAVPDPRKAVEEMLRVAKPKARLHIVAEDYGMLWCHPTPRGSDGFWQALPQVFARAVGCDNHI